MNLVKSLEILAKNIQSRLDDLERNQAWLARKAGITPAGLSRIMTADTKNPSLDSLVKIAEALGVEPASLLLDKGIKPDSITIVQLLASLDDLELRSIASDISDLIELKEVGNKTGSV